MKHGKKENEVHCQRKKIDGKVRHGNGSTI